MWGFLGVDPFASGENPLETECSEVSTGRILVSSKRLRLCGGLFLPASSGSLFSLEALGPPRVLDAPNASLLVVLNPGTAEERRRRRRRLLSGSNCSSAVGDVWVGDRACGSKCWEVDSCNTIGGIEVEGVWEEEPVLLEELGAVEVDGSSVMIGVEVGVASSARVEMAAKPPLLELRSQIGPRQDRLLRIESQFPHATL